MIKENKKKAIVKNGSEADYFYCESAKKVKAY